MKTVKWIQARSEEGNCDVANTIYVSEESDAESHHEKSPEDESNSKNEEDSDEEFVSTINNKFSALVSDD